MEGNLMRYLTTLVLVMCDIGLFVIGIQFGKHLEHKDAVKNAWASVVGGCYTSPDGYCFSERHKGACYNK